MKKYSSYFNKRYFPEPEESAEEEESLPLDPASETEELKASTPSADLFAQDSLTEIEPASSLQGLGASSAETDSFFNTEDVAPASVSDQPSGYPAASSPEPVSAFSSSFSNTYSRPISDFSSPPVSSGAVDSEVTVISKSAIINGEITVTGDIRVYGKIKGNVTAQGNVEVAGKVIGNVAGNDVELNRCEIKGDINATGFVFMDKESIMIGNVSSHDITVDGKVKGDVAAMNKVYVRSNAVIVGNLRAATIAIDEGAALQGQVVIATKESANLNINEDGIGGK